jgi:ParB-like chromosome segregation protein Spo0J
MKGIRVAEILHPCQKSFLRKENCTTYSNKMSENITPSKPQIRINPEYASLVPKLSPERFESLRQSIKEANGLIYPIIVNQDGIILDGHHRYKACQELGIEPNTIVKEFSDRLEEPRFVIECNLIRRHLNDFQRTLSALKSKPMLEAIAKRNESLGGKGDRNLTPLGRVNDRIGELAEVSRDTVRKVEKILKSSILDKIKDDLSSENLSINEGYEMVKQGQSLYQKLRKAADELIKSAAELDNLPERTKEEKEGLKAEGKEKLKAERVNYSEKVSEFYKAYAAISFWIEYRENKNNDIESVGIKTLREIVSLGKDSEIPWKKIEQLLLHAVIENKVNVNKIINSKAIQAQLAILRREREAGDSF